MFHRGMLEQKSEELILDLESENFGLVLLNYTVRLLCANHYLKNFAVNSFNSQQPTTPMIGSNIFSFYKRRNGVTESLRNLLNIIKLVNLGAGEGCV